MYDAIVIGARCGGAPTAMLLARKGYRVLLVDRATFPSDRPHGHFIHRHGPQRLQRWGMLDQILATNCPPVLNMTSDFGDLPLVGTNLVVDGTPYGCAPRRTVLDKMLIDAAVKAGAELREGFTVEELATDGGQVTGIRGRDQRGGTLASERARITIGADGRNSRLARIVQAPTYEAAPPVTCWYFSYWSGLPDNGLEVYVREQNFIFVFPTNDGLTGIFVGWPITEFHAVRAAIEANFMDALSQVPDLAERVRSGRREERFAGTADLPNFLRKPYGPGWALVGDAGCHKDPFLALGMCDAFRDAELLVEALDDGLAGERPLDEALAGYEQRRNQATIPEYRLNLHLAQFGPLPPEVRQLRAALYHNQNQADINQFILANQGVIPREAFFNPENLHRVMAAAAALA